MSSRDLDFDHVVRMARSGRIHLQCSCCKEKTLVGDNFDVDDENKSFKHSKICKFVEIPPPKDAPRTVTRSRRRRRMVLAH